MRVLLISNYRPELPYSMLKYAEMLERGLRARSHDVRTVHPPAVLGRWPRLWGPAAKWVGYIDKYLLAPGYLRRMVRWADIVHVCDHTNSMYLPCAGDKPSLITLHDLLSVFAAAGKYPGVHVKFTGRIQNRWIASGLKQARNIVSVSHKTDRDLLDLAPEIRANRWVIHHALNWDFHPVPAQETGAALAEGGLPRNLEYILHVGENGRFKNRTGVVRIFRELKKSPLFANVTLVMAGKDGTAGLRKLLAELHLMDAVLPIHPNNEDLRALYSGALALVFPSLEEGFGWPILEAQACGCPVITSNRAPMTEVAGSGAIFVNPENPVEAAATIIDAWPIAASMREAGFRNLSRFSEAAAIDAYCRVYERVVATATKEPD